MNYSYINMWGGKKTSIRLLGFCDRTDREIIIFNNCSRSIIVLDVNFPNNHEKCLWQVYRWGKWGPEKLVLRPLSWPVAELFLATRSLAFPYEPQSLTGKFWVKRAPSTLSDPKTAHLPREGPTSLWKALSTKTQHRSRWNSLEFSITLEIDVLWLRIQCLSAAA